jgi:hypothetical protein
MKILSFCNVTPCCIVDGTTFRSNVWSPIFKAERQEHTAVISLTAGSYKFQFVLFWVRLPRRLRPSADNGNSIAVLSR